MFRESRITVVLIPHDKPVKFGFLDTIIYGKFATRQFFFFSFSKLLFKIHLIFRNTIALAENVFYRDDFAITFALRRASTGHKKVSRIPRRVDSSPTA